MAFHAYLHFIATSKLTAADQRVLAYLVDRFIRHSTLSEAIPVNYVAGKLDLSDNTVSRSMAHLTDAGLLQRTAVLHRGAPTRTTLSGVARALVIAQCGITNAPAPTKTPKLELVSLSGERAEAPASVKVMADSSPAISVSDEDSPSKPTKKNTQRRRYERRFPFDTDVQASMTAKLPEGFLYGITNQCIPSDFAPNSSWNLTDNETDHLMALVDSYRREKQAKPANKAPPRPAAPALPKDIASLAFQAYPALETLASPTRARSLMDEIGYSVAHANLGHGDASGGVRAALSMIRSGRWGRPRGMSAGWNGAVLRAVGACHA